MRLISAFILIFTFSGNASGQSPKIHKEHILKIKGEIYDSLNLESLFNLPREQHKSRSINWDNHYITHDTLGVSTYTERYSDSGNLRWVIKLTNDVNGKVLKKDQTYYSNFDDIEPTRTIEAFTDSTEIVESRDPKGRILKASSKLFGCTFYTEYSYNNKDSIISIIESIDPSEACESNFYLVGVDYPKDPDGIISKRSFRYTTLYDGKLIKEEFVNGRIARKIMFNKQNDVLYNAVYDKASKEKFVHSYLYSYDEHDNWLKKLHVFEQPIANPYYFIEYRTITYRQ